MGRPPILPFNGLTVTYMALPTLIATFAKHYLPNSKSDDPKARDELSFDEAFALVKFSVEKSSQYTVEDLQRFGNTFVPAPWSVRVIRVSIPSSTCSDAAQYLIDAFGPNELQHVTGGQLWWQRRGYKNGGVEGEWIAMKKDWNRFQPKNKNVTPSPSSSSHDINHDNQPDEPNQDQTNLSPPTPITNKRISVLRNGLLHPKRHTSNPKQDPTTHSNQNSSITVSTSNDEPNSQPLKHSPSVFQKLRSLSSSSSRNRKSTVEPTPEPNQEDPHHLQPIVPPVNEIPTGGASSPVGNDEFGTGPYEADMDTMRCMLYIHGGAYYFGSVNTHRYTIWRYARKMGGRAFAVNYRLAPQYPFPCALADCLAAYLYLIRPPPEAKHRPVDPSKIVIAGDSAGGGLSLALLTLIRDCGLPPPAGAVLISPWVDLTHSFPSVMQNTETDIIPPHGFLHQPSELWPVSVPEEVNNQNNNVTVDQSETNPTTNDQVNPYPQRQSKLSKRLSVFRNISKQKQTTVEDTIRPNLEPAVDGTTPVPSPEPHSHALPSIDSNYVNPFKLTTFQDRQRGLHDVNPERPKYPVVSIEGKNIEINQQIQLYATNDQLTHPYCSPGLAPSLGGLPPLFIIAGEKEVLHDEIIYVAHRAAHPDRYPLREDLLNAHPGRKLQASLYPPTKVHLQVYDDMCHVLPLFSFARPAKYCYRAIASFCKFVTTDTKAEDVSTPISCRSFIQSEPQGPSQQHPTVAPELTVVEGSGDGSTLDESGLVTSSTVLVSKEQANNPVEPSVELNSAPQSQSMILPTPLTQEPDPIPTSTRSPSLPASPTGRPPSSWGRVTGGSPDLQRSVSVHSHHSEAHSAIHPDPTEDINPPEDQKKKKKQKNKSDLLEEVKDTIYHSTLPFNRPDFIDGMIRERVDVYGKIRPLEPEDQLQALCIPPEEIGVVKEGPVRRWAEGMAIWDHKFMKKYKKIQESRNHNIKRAVQEHEERMKERRKSAFVLASKQEQKLNSRRRSSSLDHNRRAQGDDFLSSPEWSRLSSIQERPPPSSIAARQDTSDARKLAKAVDEQVKSRGHPYKLWSGLNHLRTGADSPDENLPHTFETVETSPIHIIAPSESGSTHRRSICNTTSTPEELSEPEDVQTSTR